jgi:3-oxoisoapionate kinase
VTRLLTFYGDDFTGSTDAMEALARAGLRTVLFVEPPEPEELEALPDLAAVGIAGSTRALPTAELAKTLRPALERLRELGAPLTHYKVCSTFDSSPELGSIGRATEIGRDAFGSRYVPIVVGAPRLGRYTAFGHLFARSGLDSPAYRLDRHPTMSRHPATPMDESDLTLHLGRQTALPIELLDVVQIERAEPQPDELLDELVVGGAAIVLVDVLSERHLAAAGRLLWQGAAAGAPFVVGSSGVEYALVEHWRGLGLCGPPRPLPPPRPVDRVVAVSGSASPVNDRQIGEALAHGFEEVALDPARPGDETPVAETVAYLEQGASVILHTARGPDDPRLAGGRRDARELGDGLGGILAAILEQVHLERAIVAGGDTSAAVVRRLGARALEAVAVSAPGSPICRVHAPGRKVHGLELVLKGGQVGPTSYYVDTRGGVAAPAGKERR